MIRTPCVKVVDVSHLDSPVKVTLHARWWELTHDVIPRANTDIKQCVRVVRNLFNAKAFVFEQVLVNILMFNNLNLEDPYKFAYDDKTCTFVYFMNDGESIVVPPLPQTKSHLVHFTLFDKTIPSLRITVL